MNGPTSRLPSPQHPTAPDPLPQDPALQPERTRLAWSRTVLTGGMVTLLAWRHPSPVRGGLAVLLWLGLAAAAYRRGRQLAGARHPAPLTLGIALAVAGYTVALAALGAALLL